MSKFEEMGKVLGVARKNWFQFRDGCWRKMADLVDGFVKYCEIPASQVEFRPLDKEPEEGTRYALIGATHLGEDGFWHLGLIIYLYTAPNEFPQQPVLIELCLTEKAGKTLVKTGKEGVEREINLGDAAQRNALYEELASDIIKYFTKEPEFEETPPSTETAPLKKIGFTLGS